MFLLEFSLWFGARPLWHSGIDAVLCARPYSPGRASTEKKFSSVCLSRTMAVGELLLQLLCT